MPDSVENEQQQNRTEQRQEPVMDSANPKRWDIFDADILIARQDADQRQSEDKQAASN